MFIQTEQTPNPQTLKFLPGKVVMKEGTAFYQNIDKAADSPFAKRLFTVDGVEGVFFGSDFITITKNASYDWQVMKPSVLGSIIDHFNSDDMAVDKSKSKDIKKSFEKNGDDSEIVKQIKELLDRIDYEDTKQLDEITKQIRVFINDSEFPKEMEEEILEAYENLSASKFESVEGSALDILKTSSEQIFVAIRSSATTEDLKDASFAGQQDSFVNIKGKRELLKHVRKSFASLFTSRATYYRNKKGFSHVTSSLAVVIQ